MIRQRDAYAEFVELLMGGEALEVFLDNKGRNALGALFWRCFRVDYQGGRNRTVSYPIK